jgi:hypothetical protein
MDLARRQFALLFAPQFDKIVDLILKPRPPALDQTIPALREALRIGTDRAVDLSAVANGFFLNQAIKILLPPPIQKFEKGLRVVGLGKKLDEFILSMNRAAERASPAARGIFKDAILAITFDDARQILTGGDTAATDYFKSKTSSKLATAFQPEIEAAMSETGVVRKYNQFEKNLNALRFGRGEEIDLVAYVLAKTMDGIFYLVGQEERKIRTDPAARTTELLRTVFGGLKRNP